MFDILFFNVFNHYKVSLKRKANKIAIIYLTLVQISLFIIFGILFRLFCKQMNISAFSSEASWALSIIASIFFYFNNWMTYTGKKRMRIKTSVKNAKDYNIWLLWFLLIALFSLSAVLWQKL